MFFTAALLCASLLGVGVPAHAADDAPPIPKEWLDKKISVAEAEATHPGLNDERVQGTPEVAKPFGFRNSQWEALKAEMQPGDELWTFSSPAESWKYLAGRAGVALVRDGKPIKVVITLMN
ncbi:MAG: hypothetical protein ABSB77_00620 [Xanthobacteraceae bacterium]|jgi:hypothetical protein